MIRMSLTYTTKTTKSLTSTWILAFIIIGTLLGAAAIVGTSLSAAAAATCRKIYEVGGRGHQWVPPLSNNSLYYTNWAASITFYPGDCLQFNRTTAGYIYSLLTHGYQTCNITNQYPYTLYWWHGDANSSVTVGPLIQATSQTYPQYYNFVEGDCTACTKLGMKLVVTLSDPAGLTPTSSPAPSNSPLALPPPPPVSEPPLPPPTPPCPAFEPPPSHPSWAPVGSPLGLGAPAPAPAPTPGSTPLGGGPNLGVRGIVGVIMAGTIAIAATCTCGGVHVAACTNHCCVGFHPVIHH